MHEYIYIVAILQTSALAPHVSAASIPSKLSMWCGFVGIVLVFASRALKITHCDTRCLFGAVVIQ